MPFSLVYFVLLIQFPTTRWSTPSPSGGGEYFALFRAISLTEYFPHKSLTAFQKRLVSTGVAVVSCHISATICVEQNAESMLAQLQKLISERARKQFEYDVAEAVTGRFCRIQCHKPSCNPLTLIAIPTGQSYQFVINFRANCNGPHPISDAARLRFSHA